ncbi:flagellar basal body P-ring formation chaperone FlgA [Kosakonia cowanii]|uniref:flagellar basal body P-ring formation chaperone FlgA n=1 Tax=Kosakonia cowanii TaxID=208223 RepID=UPI0040638E30
MLHTLLRPLCLLLLGCALSFAAQAASAPSDPDAVLESRIAKLLAANHHGAEENAPRLRIHILTPKTKRAALCERPDLRLSGHPVRLTGNRSVIAKCGRKQHFIQIKVSASGRYWIAARLLKPGQTIGPSDIQPLSGELDKLPAGLLLDANKIVGRTPTRTLRPGQPLTENQLRQRWLVVANQEVEIVAPGEGFLIHAKGKALNNAALNEGVRLQTRSGRVVAATAVAEGTVSIKIDN